jgi:hypothetical protein
MDGWRDDRGIIRENHPGSFEVRVRSVKLGRLCNHTLQISGIPLTGPESFECDKANDDRV